MASSVKVNGVWKNTPTYNVKVNGVWKPATNAYVKVNGVWKQYFTAGGGSTGPGPVTGVPVINSSPSLSLGYDGVTMQVAAGSWLGGVDTYSYEWFINGSSTSAYGPTQSATAGLIGSPGAQYYVKVTATNTSGSTTAVSNTIGLPAKATAAAPAAVVVSAPATPSVSLGYTDVPSVWSSTGSNWTTEGYITLQWNYVNVDTSKIIVKFGGVGDIAAHAAITSPTTADVHSPYNVTGTVFVIVDFQDGTSIRSNEIAYTNLHQQVTDPVVPTVVTPPSGGGGAPAPATVTLYQYTTTVQGTSGNISGSGATGQTVSIPASVYATGDPNLIQAAIIAAGGTIVAYNPNIGTGIPATGVTTTTNYSTSSNLTGSAATSVTGLPGAYVPPTTTTTTQTVTPTVKSSSGTTAAPVTTGTTTVTPATVTPTTIPGATSSTTTSGGYSGIPTTTTTTQTSTAILPFSGSSTGSSTTTKTVAPGVTQTTTTTTTAAYVGSTLQNVQTTKTTTTATSTASTSTKTTGGCFLFGTPVLKADGSWINIEQLQPGDELVSVILPGLPENEEGWDWLDNWSMKNLRNIEKTTTVVVKVNRSSYWKYYIINGTIKVTLEHPVLVKQGGVWRFNHIEYVNIGDSILDENLNEIVIKGKKEVQDEVAVVGIDTEIKDTYFVKGMLAHNQLLPVSKLKAQYL